ncbi:MAG: glycine cleavage system aminomethyltransferase GcvT [Methylomonas sp.]|nr:glycine cleavage system aminomethyltransferase GcvT [Methylomonas sp.]
MNDLKQTPLCELHRQLGAKMTAFAGYALPVQYPKGIIHEHLHCRSHAGFFDISHMGQCHILGERAAEALERLTPGGIVDLAVGRQKYTVLTNEEGGVIDDIIVTRNEEGLSMVVNAACKAKDFAYLCARLSFDCEFSACNDLALLALQGPEAVTVIEKFSKDAARLAFMQACPTQLGGVACTISRCGYTGEDGFEISLPQTEAEYVGRLLLAEPGVEAIGLGARDTLRLEAGLCLYGHELNENITPVEAGLKWIFKKGHSDFPGADKVLRQLQGGCESIRVGLAVEGRIPVREGAQMLTEDDEPAGFVTSGGFSPSLNRPVAMASIRREYAAIGTPLFASVRGNRIAVSVCRLPFVPHRYHR